MIRDDLAAAIRSTLESLGVTPPAIVQLEQPARREHGDWSTNVALATAKAAGRNPRELAQAVADALSADLPPHVDRVELAGPGFINFYLRPTWLHDVLVEVVTDGEAGYAAPDVGQGRRVMVEFVSANPTGPLHAGHARGATYGDALARMLERTGHQVTREFYINDRGSQMAKMGASIAARAAGEEPPEGGYHGAYITEWAKDLPADADPTEFGYARALADQREVLAALDINFDVWFSERTLVASGAIESTLAELAERGATYESDGAVWLRTTDHGDDKDRVLVKSDGDFTYVLPDIAYHRDKLTRGHDLLIDVLGADHHGYVARMRAALISLGYPGDVLEAQLTQMVRLMRDGEEVKLSKRTGDIIELRDLIDEVGPDATRLTYLLQSVDSPQTIDLAVIVSQSMDNPVFYVQMAHARLCSLARVADERGLQPPALADTDLSVLVHDRELEVLRGLFDLPDLVALAARERSPHKVTAWVREFAGTVHGFYHDCPIVKGDVPVEVAHARWWLGQAAGIGLRIGLGLLGVTAPESMS